MVVVTRHKALVNLLMEKGIVGNNVKVVEHTTPVVATLRGKMGAKQDGWHILH